MMKEIYKYIIASFFLVSSINAQTTTITNFPYYQNFRNATMPSGWVRPGTVGTAVGNNNAVPTSIGLELTPAEQSRFGGIVLDGVDFNSSNGITISFEFSMTEGQTFDSSFGDGFAFFLFDSSKPATLGAPGRGVGYSQGDGVNGVDGGYLGIGFDVFGNNKGRHINRSGVVENIYQGTFSRNHITMRGAMGETRLNGYPLLFTQKVDVVSDNTNNLKSTLDVSNGVLNHSPLGLTSSNIFQLRSTVLSSSVNDINYRRAIITLLPRIGGGMRVTLDVTHGSITTRVLNSFDYPTSLKYTRNPTGETETVVSLDTPVPAKFQLGFSAGTGLASQRHLIRDVEISIPYMAETKEDVVSMCMTFPQKSVPINPFTNDKFYRGPLTGTPGSGQDGTYIDFNSIQFSDVNDNVLGSTVPGAKNYVQTGVGTWTTNPANGTVVFLPMNGFKGVATIYYTAKGFNTNSGPFDQEIYRSAPQKITVNVVRCGSIINPNIPSGGVIRSGK